MKQGKLIVLGDHEPKTLHQMHEAARPDFVDRGILCADGHLGYGQPVGGVIASETHISMSGVGFDIGCGTLAVKTNLRMTEDGQIGDQSLSAIANGIAKFIPFGLGQCDGANRNHAIFDDERWNEPGISDLKNLARQQLGSVGSGNHYVDVFVDPLRQVWVGVHFGSRGFGYKTAKAFYDEAGAKDGMEAPCCFIEVRSDIGRRYITAMSLALDYALAGRHVVVDRVLRMMEAESLLEIDNHHNMAHLEDHEGRLLWVTRKGSQTAFPGHLSFIGGSMGQRSVVVRGKDSEASRERLYSVPHGAGRLMSRGQAKREIDFEAVKDSLPCVLRGAGADEAPACYRHLDDVLRPHGEGETLEVAEWLTPVIVVMAGKDQRDPYKD